MRELLTMRDSARKEDGAKTGLASSQPLHCTSLICKAILYLESSSDPSVNLFTYGTHPGELEFNF